MNDDIVTRLREIQDGSKHDDIYDELMYAIDEIERLRNEVKVRDLQILANFKSMDAMHKELYGESE